MAKICDQFKVFYKQEGDQHSLTFVPAQNAEGYEKKTIAITAEQWNELKYHFMTAIDDRAGVTKLAYVK